MTGFPPEPVSFFDCGSLSLVATGRRRDVGKVAKSCGQYPLTTTFEEIGSSEASLRGETESERVKKLVKNSRRTSNRLPSSQLDLHVICVHNKAKVGVGSETLHSDWPHTPSTALVPLVGYRNDESHL